MVVSRKAAGWAGVAVAACALALAPSTAASIKSAKQRASAISLSAPGSLGSFTPAAANPKLAAAFSSAGIAGSGGGFRFTPASSTTNRRSVTVAVRARASTKEEAQRIASSPSTSIAPTAYNLGVAVGWKRFALTGEVARVDGALLPGREAVDLGLSYNAPKWSTKFQLGADRPTDVRSRLIGTEESVSADLSGSYAITRNLEVTGGVRYRLQRDRLMPVEDDRRDSQAVYIGTAFKF
ncbi:hypothetical protein [Sphingomonas sp. DBB INV C78]|uniref:hypothetical protein n=1 Tax=Sphingomonas sp. DBB INV C78 TaxID=3349434 RepID=UPI0036D36E11